MPDSEALFLEYRSRLFRYLARAAGSADAAQDLTQEVFLRVSRAGVPVAEAGQVAAWLFRIARNVVIDHHRRNGRAPAVVSLVSDHPSPSSQEAATALDQALALLDTTDRDVFLMREVGGLSYDEIATACELSADAVRSRIYRSRLQLRNTLSADVASIRKGRMRHSGAPR